jgi:hypothetical protein
MSVPGHVASDAGTTLPEVLIAGALTVAALTLVTGTVLAPLGAVGRAAEPDQVARELEVAADVVARLLRATVHSGTAPAVEPTPGGLVLRLRGEQGAVGPTARLVVDGGRLLILDVDSGGWPGGWPLVLPPGPLATGLDDDLTVLELIGAATEQPGGAAASVAAVRFTLHADGREATRVVRMRGGAWR